MGCIASIIFNQKLIENQVLDDIKKEVRYLRRERKKREEHDKNNYQTTNISITNKCKV